ncbi:formimidoyltransferase-cyclodeaminase [Lepeophtheirus salmonis]|uniref:formimidoyltransferase-cyclodeaminase n=1 Tax=Lepeophtheirus salmonis TaxID=72036 RepID=UPI001AE8F853|nr:formimidoyltransferase-cyclodeaminase-like [Lepeophtheirus salmonis]
MTQIIECVPNFSEGKDPKIIEAISDAVKSVQGVTLLDVDPGSSTNRTVYTFVGDPESIVEGALAAAKAAYSLIDMSKHSGEHPRLGALDVCPFIPVRGVTVEEAIQVSKNFGKRLADELSIPVYLYGYSADPNKPYRKTMPQIREGEYEGLKDKIQKKEWAPDFGPSTFVPSWGATVTGVRKFLIAYNVNLLGTKEQAHKIAIRIREKGAGKGKPGKFKCVQGMGWFLEECNIAQVSLNVTDMDETPMHAVFEECKSIANSINVAVAGSEVVGLLPLSTLLEAAEYYIKQENLFILEEDQKVKLAINRLGLSTLSPFNPKERIIEYCLPEVEGPLASLSVKDFILTVGARTPTPGGGSVSAVVGALGAGLCAMMGQLSWGRKKWEHIDKEMREILPGLVSPSRKMISFIDADTEAFNKYMTSLKLPSDTPEQIEAKEEAMDQGLKTSTGVPFNLAKLANNSWESAIQLAEIGNMNCKSDLEVGSKLLEVAVYGASRNVLTNLKDIKDEDFKKKMTTDIEKEVLIAKEKCALILEILERRDQEES